MTTTTCHRLRSLTIKLLASFHAATDSTLSASVSGFIAKRAVRYAGMLLAALIVYWRSCFE